LDTSHNRKQSDTTLGTHVGAPLLNQEAVTVSKTGG